MDELPDTLKPYHSLGLEFRTDDDQARADCPWCGRDQKFSVHIETGLWRCLVCNEGSDNGKPVKGGNATTFVRLLWDKSMAETKESQLADLATDRKLQPSTLKQWGVCISTISGDYLVPGWSPEGKLKTLYRYISMEERGRKLLLPTPTMKHHLLGVNLFKPKRSIAYLCEGLWDSAALWEVLKAAKLDEDGEEIKPTSNAAASMLSNSNVVGIPAATVFAKGWCNMFGGMAVVLCPHSDHPKVNPTTKQVSEPAGFAGMQRIAQALAKAEQPPASMSYLHWGDEGYDPDRKSGYDVRDLLTELA